MKHRIGTSVAVVVHVLLLCAAGVSYLLEVEPSLPSAVVLGALVIWFVYLALTKPDSSSRERAPKLARFYFVGLAPVWLLTIHLFLIREGDLPDVPFRLALMGFLLPFAMVLRMGRR